MHGYHHLCQLIAYSRHSHLMGNKHREPYPSKKTEPSHYFPKVDHSHLPLSDAMNQDQIKIPAINATAIIADISPPKVKCVFPG